MDIECKVCRSLIFKEQMRSPCPRCDNRTCVYCNRMCDICLRNFCFNHVKVRKTLVPGGIQMMKLCEFCKDTWAA